MKQAALLRTLAEHRYEVCSVAFSPDGSLLASGGGYRDNTIRLWDTRTWGPTHVLRGHKGKVSCLGFHPSGETLVSASHDKTAKLWDTRTGELKATFAGHKGIISSVAFSPGGRTLATADHGGVILLRTGKTGDVASELTGHTGCVLSVAFSADGKTLASAGGVERQVAEVRLWDAATCRLKGVLGGHSDWVLWVAFSPDRQTLGSGSYGEILLTEAATGTMVRRMKDAAWSLVAFDFSPDGAFVVSGGWTFPTGEDGRPDYRQAIGGLQLWDARTGKQRRSFTAHEQAVTSISYLPDGRTLASGGRDGTVKLWDLTRLLEERPGE